MKPAKKMSDREAGEEAQRRFGADGVAFHHTCSKRTDWDGCRVGLSDGDDTQFWKVLGRGRDWEEAFLDAERRRKKT